MDFQKIIVRAWDDDAFKKELLASPRQVIERETGIKLPAEIDIYIHEQTPTTLHLILPMKPESD